MPDNIRKLYDRLVADNYEMPGFDQFSTDMRDSTKRQSLYDHISTDYELPDFDQFSTDMGIEMLDPSKKKVQQQGDGSMLQQPEGSVYPWEQKGTNGKTPSSIEETLKQSLSASGGANGGSPQPEETAEDRRKRAVEFILDDYRGNKESIDRAVSRTPQNPLGSVHTPVNFMDAGPVGDLIKPDGDPENFRKYVQDRLFQLDQTHKQKVAELEKQYPDRTEYAPSSAGIPIPIKLGRDGQYDKLVAVENNSFAEQKRKLQEAASILAASKVYQANLKIATPEQVNSGQFVDVSKMGKEVLRITSDPTEKHPISEEVDKIDRYEAQGIPITPAQKAMVDKAGLDAAQYAVFDQVKEATKDGQPLPEGLQVQLKAVQGATKKFWADHDDYRREQVINLLSNQIAKDKGGWKMFTDLGVNDTDIKDAATKIGLGEQWYADIKKGDIKQQNAVGATASGFLGVASDIGGFFTSRVRRAMGQSEDWIEYATGESKRKFANLGGVLGTNPDVQSLFNPLTDIENDPESSRFLFNKPADPAKAGKFSWNAASILNTIGNATGQLAAYAAGGDAGAAAGLGRDAGMMSTLFASSYDHNYAFAKEMGIKDEGSANGYAFIRSLTNAFIFTKLIPHAKIEDALLNPGGAAGKDLFGYIEKTGMDQITKQAMKPLVSNVIAETLKDTGKVLAAAEIDKAADFVTASAFDPHAIDDRDFLKESAQEGLSLALATVIPSALGAGRKERQMSDLYKNMIYDMGTRPEPYIQSVYKAMQEGNIPFAEAQKNMKVIATMARAVNKTPDYSSLSDKPLSERQRMDYTVNLVRDNLLREKLETVKDDVVQSRPIETELKELEKKRTKILTNAEGEGSISVTTGDAGTGQAAKVVEPTPKDNQAPTDTTASEPTEPVKPNSPGPQGTGGAGVPAEKVEVTGADHPVMTKEEFRNLKVGDPVHMETPAGKIISDEIAEVNNGEVKLKNTGVFRNETVVDPANVGYRFVKPTEGTQKTEAASTTPAPKTSETAPNGAVREVGANVVQSSDLENQRADIEKRRQEELNRPYKQIQSDSEKKREYQRNSGEYPKIRDVVNKWIDYRKKQEADKNYANSDQADIDHNSLTKEFDSLVNHISPEMIDREVFENGKTWDATRNKFLDQYSEANRHENKVNAKYDNELSQLNSKMPASETTTQQQTPEIKTAIDLRKQGHTLTESQFVEKWRSLPADEIKKQFGDLSAASSTHAKLVAKSQGKMYRPPLTALTAPQQQLYNQAADLVDRVNSNPGAKHADKLLWQHTASLEHGLLETFRTGKNPNGEAAPQNETAKQISVTMQAIEQQLNDTQQTQSNDTTTQTGASGRNAAPGAEPNRAGENVSENVQDGATAEVHTPEEGAGEESNSQRADEGSKQKSANGKKGRSTKEEEIRSRLEEKKKAFHDALRKARGKLNVNPMDVEVIKNGIEMLAAYAELGFHKFSEIARDLIKTLGREFTTEDVDALRGVYAYERSLRKPDERAKMESDEAIDTFVQRDLPALYEPAPKIPKEVRLGKEGHVYKYVGLNSEGKPIYENAEGVRTIPAEKGSSIFTTEPVSIIPTKGGIEAFVDNRRNEYKTVEELAKRPLESELVERAADAERNFIDRVRNAIWQKEKVTIHELRKFADEFGIEKKDTYLQDLAETAVVEIARSIKQEGLPDERAFSQIVELYNQQPSFNMRSSERVEKQQYSTPAPISFAAGMYVGHKNPDLTLEPSAGNGLMTIYLPPSKVHTNEIDPVRLSNLQRQGYAVVSSQDATKPFDKGIKYGGVISNPPFGSAAEKVFDGYKIKGLDEQMIINALDSMADSGRASLIMGGHMSYDDKGRLKADRTFFNYLYNHYNVADVINIDGGLYSKQGTTFPIRLILIDGRKSSPNGVAPLKSTADAVVGSFPELFDRVNKIKKLDLYGSVLQSGLDVRPGQGDPLYGDDAAAANVKATTSNELGSPTSTTDTAVTPASGSTGAVSTNNGSASGGSVAGGQRAGTSTGNLQQPANANGNQSVPIRANEPGAATGSGNRAAQTNGGNAGVPADNPQQVPTSFDAARMSSEKVPYIPRSRSLSVGSVIPTQMASEIERVLDDVAREVGGIDEFVRSELGYPDTEKMYAALSAEQIDAVALGIRQIQKGQSMIIGDQTGVGKGRIAASMIRWAVRQGHKPILLTEKANLFSDFYRDMIAVGSANLVPFIVNDKSVSSDPTITDEQGNVLYKPQPSGVKKSAFAKGEIPADANFVMATYSQFSDNKETTKKTFLRKIAEGNVIITDESHNMSGDSNTGIFFQSVLANAAGGMYLSATFAKRPDNMPIYAVKTAMSEANMTHADLINAIQRGGVALQEVVSAELAEAGQMLRRERDFTGVTIDYEVLDDKAVEYQGKVDNVTSIMRDVIAFQDAHIQPLISQMDDAAKGEGGMASTRKGTNMGGVDNVPFASKVFQVVHQLLFALKANDIADAAIQELRANRKPVIGFNSTMESFFDYMGLQPGDALGKADFSLSLLRGLEGTMRYTEKDEKGNSVPKSFSLADLTPEGQDMYAAIRAKIQSASTGIPISPIDAITKRLEDAGYTVKEITGRQISMRYDDEGGGKIEARKERDKNKISREFNNGSLDVIMINASGSTGLSLHASKTFKDQRQRTLISGQLELDVNTEVQKRGRIDRTGQVARGRYRYIVSPIPAEKRLLMMFRSKLKSLDANTTSSQKQKTSDVAVIDFLNKHGDQVVLEYLANNQLMNLSLRDPLKLLAKTEEDIAELKAKGGEARMVTGRVALLPSDKQEKFYNEIIEMYQKHIEMLESIGQNDLEVKAMPLEARTISSDVIIEGKGGTSPFGKNSVLEKVEANVLRKPLTQAELHQEIKKALADRNPQQVAEQMADEAETYMQNYMEAGREDIRKRHQQKRENAWGDVDKKAAKLKTAPSDAERLDMYKARIDEIDQAELASLDMYDRKEGNNLNSIVARMNYFKVGRAYGVPTSLNADVSSAYVPGIFLGFEVGNSTENRYRPSNISMRFATPLGSLRMVQVPLSRTNYINAVVANTNFTPPSEWQGLVDNWESRARTGDRQTRYIVSGNILQGYNYAPGQLVSYTTADGQLRKGVLLSEDWKPEKDAVLRLPIGRAQEHLEKTGSMQSSNGEVSLETASAGYLISVPAAKSTGGKYYLHTGLRNLVSGKDFKQSGARFIAQFSKSKLPDVLKILQDEFNLAVNVPKLNLKSPTLPKELQVSHDQIAYTDKPAQLARAGAATQAETANIAVSDIKPRTFAQDFVEQTVKSHFGYEVGSHRDIADLFSLYRSPSIEKSHLVFVKDGVIVANHAITSNSPTETPSWNPSEVAMLATAYGADGVFLVHNHPSGNPEPSQYDVLITENLAQRLPQYNVQFKGHVILDGDRYAFLDKGGRLSFEKYSTPQSELFSPRYQFSETPSEFMGQAVDVAHYILKDNKGQTGIVYVDPENRVSGYDLVAPKATAQEIIDTVKNNMVANGASNYYIVSDDPHPDLLKETMPNGILGEVSLNGGVRGGAEFAVEPESENPNEVVLHAPRRTTAGAPPPAGTAPSTAGVPPPFTVELEKTSRVKAFADKTKKNMTELFAVGGGIEKALRDIKEEELGNFNELKAKARHIQQDFNHVIRSNYGKNKLDVKENAIIDSALKGDVAAMGSLAAPVQEVVTKMRNYIDELTRRMVEAGVIPDAEILRQQIQDHLDSSAAAGVEPNENYLRILRTKLAFAEKIENNIGTYVNRAYLKFRVPDWREKVSQEKIDAATHYIYNEALLQGRGMTQEQATDVIEDILKSNSLEHVMTASKFAVNFNILKKLKEIPAPIRDLMGEVKEAEWNFMNTVTKMAALLERHKFLYKFHDAAVGKFFGHARDTAAGFTEQLKQPAWGPLNGVWTSPELAQALKEWDGDTVDQSALMKFWRDANGISKSVKTTLSWVSELRNLIGNISLTMFNGNFNPTHFKSGFLAIKDVFNSVKGDQAREYVEKLNRLRIVGTSLPFNEIRGMVNELTASLPELSTDDPLLTKKIWNGLVAFKNKAAEVYGATDDIYKIMTWEMEKSRLKEAYEKSGVTKTEDQIEREAADITLRIMPTFSKVPKVVKTLSYNTPLIGTFISYPAELMRTTYNSVGLSIEQMKSDNPEIRKLGAKRFAWHLGTAAFPYILSGMAGLLASALGYGVSKEEKETVMKLLPEYYENDNVIVWKKKGKYYVWMGSGFDGHSYLRETINAAVRGDDAGIANAVKTWSAPFAQPTLPLQKVIQYVKNRDQYDRKIILDADEQDERAVKTFKHFGDLATPQTANDILKPIQQFSKGNDDKGWLGVLKLATGQSVLEIDPNMALMFKQRDLDQEKKDIREKAGYDSRHGKSAEEVNKWVGGRLQELQKKYEELDKMREILK